MITKIFQRACNQLFLEMHTRHMFHEIADRFYQLRRPIAQPRAKRQLMNRMHLRSAQAARSFALWLALDLTDVP